MPRLKHIPSVVEQIATTERTLEETAKALIGKRFDYDDWFRNYEDDTVTFVSYSGTIVGVNEQHILLRKYRARKITQITCAGLAMGVKNKDVLRILRRREEALEQQERLRNTTEYDIYILIDPRNGTVRYVGRTTDPETRYRQHLNCDGNNTEKNTWIRELREQDLRPQMLILETIKGRAYSKEREAHVIHAYIKAGAPLTNRDYVIGVEVEA